MAVGKNGQFGESLFEEELIPTAQEGQGPSLLPIVEAKQEMQVPDHSHEFESFAPVEGSPDEASVLESETVFEEALSEPTEARQEQDVEALSSSQLKQLDKAQNELFSEDQENGASEPSQIGGQLEDERTVSPSPLPDKPSRRSEGKSLERRDYLFLNLVDFTALLVIIPVLFFFFYKPSYEAAEVYQQNLNSIAFPIVRGEAGSYYPIGQQRLLRLERTSVSLLNRAGIELDRYPISLNKPLVVREGKQVLLAELDGYRYLVLRAGQRAYEGKTEFPIKGASLSPNGQTVLLLEQESSLGLLRLLDANGKKRFDWIAQDRSKSGHILGAKFGHREESLLISLYNTDSAKPNSIVQRMSLQEGKLGELMETFSLEELGPITYLQEISQGRVLMASGRYLLDKKANGELKRLAVEQVGDVLSHEGGLVFLGSLAGQEERSLYFWSGDEVERLDSGQYGERSRLFKADEHSFALLRSTQVLVFQGKRWNRSASKRYHSEVLEAFMEPSLAIFAITKDQIFWERR